MNKDLTDKIINKFIESKSFQEEMVLIEPIIEDPEIHEDDVYKEILLAMREKGLEVTLEDIIKIINILKFTPEQIYDIRFIEVYNNHQHLKDEELEEILEDWIKGQQNEEIYDEILSESGDENMTEDEEIIVNTPPEIPSSTESYNSTRSNSPNNLNMATEDHVKQYIRQTMNLTFGIDLGQNIDQVPGQTVTQVLNQAVGNLVPPINRAAKIGELPIFNGGDQDPYEWERDFEIVWNANGYLEGNNQVDKIRKAAACMRGDAADWYNEVENTINSWNANNGDDDFCVELRKRYASRTKQNQWTMELQNIK
jgi:hypothetical protein